LEAQLNEISGVGSAAFIVFPGLEARLPGLEARLTHLGRGWKRGFEKIGGWKRGLIHFVRFQ
jgi:hypothetical protein